MIKKTKTKIHPEVSKTRDCASTAFMSYRLGFWGCPAPAPPPTPLPPTHQNLLSLFEEHLLGFI